ncbi:MAG: hypothetical protein K8S54_11140 [Spirochaetia bacterium]|nr:hypothetical protein [Spirochaetia bacterium]
MQFFKRVLNAILQSIRQIIPRMRARIASLLPHLRRAFEKFAYWMDPHLLRFLEKSAPLRLRILNWLFKLYSFFLRTRTAVWRIVTAPFRGLAEVFRILFGSITFTPSDTMRELVALKGRITSALRFQESKTLQRLKRFKEDKPPLFRTAALLTVSFSLVLGSCTSFQLFRKMTQIQVTVTDPEYTKPTEETIPAPVIIHFSAPAVRIDQIGKNVELQMVPSHPGIWTFIDDSTITFTPAQHWPPGKSYTVTLRPELFSPGVKLAETTVAFESPEFSGRVTGQQFYIDPKDPSIKKAVITLEFTHPVEAKQVDEKVSFEYSDGLLSGKEIAHTTTLDESQMIAYIHSANVSIQEKEAKLKFKLSSGVTSREGSGRADALTASVVVPGKFTHFAINRAEVQLVRNEFYELDQVLFLETTSGITPDELQQHVTLFELPVDKPEEPGTEGAKNYRWSSPKEISPTILAKSRRLATARVEGENETGNIHPYRVTANEGGYLFVRIDKAAKALGDFQLKDTFEAVVRIPDFTRETRIMHDGAILSLAGEKKISVLSYDNDSIEFEIGRILPDQINHLISQSYGNFNSPYFSNYNFNEDNISERLVETVQLNRLNGKRLQYASFDFTRYLAGRGARLQNGLFYLKVRGFKKDKKKQEAVPVEGADEPETSEESERPQGRNEDKRLVLVSDLGILVKHARSGTRDVFVQSFAQGRPVGNVEIQVIGKNGLPIATQMTDASGHAMLPDLADFKREKAPVAFIAKAGSDLSFMPFARDDRRLDFSKFEIGGVQGADTREKLTAYIFSDRGIYRPGDEIRAGMVIKAGDWKRNLFGLPVEVTVRDSRGIEVYSQTVKLSPAAFEEVKYKTEESSPTGSYEIRASLISKTRNQPNLLLGSTSVKVEEFLPDKLRITAQFSSQVTEEAGWTKPEGLKGDVQLMNLFGTPAQRKKIQGTLILAPRFPVFRGYENYKFFDPLRTTRSFRQDLGSVETDDQGHAEFKLGLEKYAKGIYQVTFHADGFEAEGGRAVSAQSTQIVSPLSQIIGIRTDGDMGYIHLGSARSVSLIAIDNTLKRVAASKLILKIIEARPVSSLVKREDGIYEYKTTIKEIPVIQHELNFGPGGLDQILPTGTPGDFLLSIVDENHQELNRIAYSVIGQGNLARSLEKNAELSIKLSGKDFVPGQEIELAIRAPYTGAGLITIEKDKVYAHKWFQTTTESSVQRIRLPEALEGNGYVNVTFVRALDSKAIYTSPLSYGVVPFSVSKKNRTANLILNAPAEIKPGDLLRIQYTTDRPGKVVVFAVDEGILQVARYKRPDPLSHFFQKRALEVSTSQIVDQLLPEFSIVRSLTRIGGDADKLIGLNLNPFKRKRQSPVAYWSGLRDVAGAGEVSFTVPDYFNGRIKIYAVLVSDSVLGVEEKGVLVRGDFIISPSVATFSAPGDTFEISANVSNNVAGSGKDLAVNVQAVADGSIEILGDSIVSLSISERGEKTVRFKARAKLPGEGRVVLRASSGNRSGTQTETVSVRPARPYIMDVQSGYLLGGNDEIQLTRQLYPEFRKQEVSVSPVPLAWSSGLYAYLENYPYGCTEQITSRGLAALILKNRPEIARGSNDQIIAHTLKVLQSRQNAQGAFGFWAANSYVDPFQSAYAVLFLTEARERGIAVPNLLLSQGLAYLESLAQNPENSTLHDRAFALYVLARNGRIKINEVNGLMTLVARDSSEFARLPLMYLAATRKLMRQDKEAEELFENSRPGLFKTWIFGSFDSVSANSNYLYLLSRHFPGNFEQLGDKTIASFLAPMRAGEFSTISAASSILAIDAYLDLRKSRKLDLKVTQENASGVASPLMFPDQLFAKSPISPDTKKMTFKGNSALPAFYQVTIGGFDQILPAPYNKGMDVSREITDENGNTLKSATVGSEVFVRVRIRARDSNIANVAIVDLFPGGFEPIFEGGRPDEPVGLPGLKPRLMKPDHVDIREERIVIFTSAESNAQEYVYRLRAVSPGKFVIPPLFAEAMYNKSFRALTAEGSFEIVSRK